MVWYENDTDRRHEEQIASQSEQYLSAIYQTEIKIPKRIDLKLDRNAVRISDNRIVAIIECKWRYTPNLMNRFSSIIIDVAKVNRGKTDSKRVGCPFYFAIGCDSGFYIAEILDKEYVSEIGGRTDATRDLYDIEPVFHIPTEDFIKID